MPQPLPINPDVNDIADRVKHGYALGTRLLAAVQYRLATLAGTGRLDPEESMRLQHVLVNIWEALYSGTVCAVRDWGPAVNCILCATRELDPCNGSQVCAECRALVWNLFGANIEERWLPVAGIDGVIVSDRGRIARLLTVDNSGHRYPRVSIAGHKRFVHTLVAETSHGPRPPGLLVLHGDDDPENPAAANLRYGTHAQNAADRRRNHRRKEQL